MIIEKLDLINAIISHDQWCDFQIEEFDGFALTLICGIDLPQNWLLKILFKKVNFVSLKSEWKKKDDLPAIELWQAESARYINSSNRIEVGNHLFKLNHEDNNESNSNAFIIAAESIDFLINPKYANRLAG